MNKMVIHSSCNCEHNHPRSAVGQEVINITSAVVTEKKCFGVQNKVLCFERPLCFKLSLNLYELKLEIDGYFEMIL